MIVYAPRALRDLQTIEAYIQQFNAPAARRVITAIKRAIDTLGSFPNIGRGGSSANQCAALPLCGLLPRCADVLILHVRHTAQKPIDLETEL
jgi:plasmid stabilization system protein ParE